MKVNFQSSIGAESITGTVDSLPLEGKVPEGRMRCLYAKIHICSFDRIIYRTW